MRTVLAAGGGGLDPAARKPVESLPTQFSVASSSLEQVEAKAYVALKWTSSNMAAFDSALSHDSEARRLAVEVIATLVNVKRIAADQILRPAKVPDDLVRRFLTGNDATTGQPLTKRQAGALILDELARRGAQTRL